MGERAKLLKVAMVHNYYRSGAPSGENVSFEEEASLIENRGHQVLRFVRRSDDLLVDGLRSKLRLAMDTVWAESARQELESTLRQERPDVCHFQNTFPAISPAAYHACRNVGIPVVQAIRNYRLACLNAQFTRDGNPCEACLGKFPWRGVVHRCYRESTPASAVVAGMLVVHRTLRTWQRAVDLYVAPSTFTAGKIAKAGIPLERIAVKPNCLSLDPGPGRHEGGFLLFAGRLEAVKGVPALLQAWERVGRRDGLVVAGDGPLAPQVRDAERRGLLRCTGQVAHQELLSLLGDARAVVVPSLAPESFGRVVIEAFARGTPAIVTRVGALPELVHHGRTGLVLEAGDVEGLAGALASALDEPERWETYGQEARTEFLKRFGPEAGYRQLIEVYERALSCRSATT